MLCIRGGGGTTFHIRGKRLYRYKHTNMQVHGCIYTYIDVYRCLDMWLYRYVDIHVSTCTTKLVPYCKEEAPASVSCSKGCVLEDLQIKSSDKEQTVRPYRHGLLGLYAGCSRITGNLQNLDLAHQRRVSPTGRSGILWGTNIGLQGGP